MLIRKHTTKWVKVFSPYEWSAIVAALNVVVTFDQGWSCAPHLTLREPVIKAGLVSPHLLSLGTHTL